MQHMVCPHEAGVQLKRNSVLTPVGAALIGLSIGQAIELQTPGHQKRPLMFRTDEVLICATFRIMKLS
jgi:hypothetical protein